MNDLINKHLYKIFLVVVKYIPLITALIQIILTIFNYFGVAATSLTYLGGTSILFIVLLFIISYVFKFCYLFRIPLWYNTIIIFLSILRNFGYLPIEIIDLYRIYAIISGIFITLFVVYIYKNRNKTNNIDYIKNLCERYNCDCK